MRKNKALFALLAGVVAAALFAVPATAMAETTTVTQESLTDGVYTIEEPGEYALGENINGRIEFAPNTKDGQYSLDLAGYTLKSEGDGSAIQCYSQKAGNKITVSNGTVVKTGTNKQAIRADCGVSLTVDLNGVNVEATDSICVYTESSNVTVNINGGSYKTSNKTSGVDESVICVNEGTVNVAGVNDGSTPVFTLDGGTNIVKVNNPVWGCVLLSGGVFSSFPDAAMLSDTSAYSFHKTSKGFEVVSGTDLPDGACWKLTYDGTLVFFDSTADKDEFVESHACSDVEHLRAVVTFDPANGDDPVERVVAVNGTAAGQVEDPIKADGVFKYWSADGKTDFDIGHTPITGDTKLTAVYGEAVATNGTEGYASLQEAINDNGHEASTVTLLKDITESVSIYQCVALTINLGGKTLTSEDGCDAIHLASKGTLTITNGNVVSYGDGLYVSPSAAGSTVNLASEGELSEGPLYFSKLESDEDLDFCGAVYVCGGAETTTLNIMGGSYESAGYYAIYVEGDVTLNVTDGQFSNGLKDEDYSTITAEDGSNVEFAGERVSDHILLDSTSTATVHSGKFGDATNAGDVVEGKYLYKGNKEYYEGKDEYYEVLDYEDALDASDYVVYNEDFSTRVYFATYEDAKAYAASIGDESVIVNLYHVPFLVKGEQYYYHTYEVGEEIGELPEAPEFEDYTFAGWYVNGEKIDSTYKVNDDITVVAMWYWNGSSDEEPTDNPEAKGNKKLPQTGDPAMAVSGIAAAGAALAGIGALRRRK